MVSRGWEMEKTVNGYKISLGGDKNILGLG